MMRAFRCYNPKCMEEGASKPGWDFIANEAKCPKCGIDSANAVLGKFVVPLVWIHFEPPSGVVEGVGSRILACTGKPSTGFRVSGEPSAVNCPECIATAVYHASQVAGEVHPDYALPLEIDLAKGSLKTLMGGGTDGA